MTQHRMNISNGAGSMTVSFRSQAEMYLFKAVAFANADLRHGSASGAIIEAVLHGRCLIVPDDIKHALDMLDDPEFDPRIAKTLFEQYREKYYLYRK